MEEGEVREFTQEETARIDEVYEETLKFCRSLARDENLECGISVLGPIAEAAAEILKDHGISAWFPYIDGKGGVHQYY